MLVLKAITSKVAQAFDRAEEGVNRRLYLGVNKIVRTLQVRFRINTLFEPRFLSRCTTFVPTRLKKFPSFQRRSLLAPN